MRIFQSGSTNSQKTGMRRFYRVDSEVAPRVAEELLKIQRTTDWFRVPIGKASLRADGQLASMPYVQVGGVGEDESAVQATELRRTARGS